MGNARTVAIYIDLNPILTNKHILIIQNSKFKMLASPLFSKYYDKPKPDGDINSVPSERKWCLFGVNVGLTYILSLFTYMLSFTSVLSYDINTI